jgi:hypothetical protein
MYQPENAPAEPVSTPMRPDLRVVAQRRTSRRQMMPKSWMITIAGLVVAVLVMYVHTVVQEENLKRVKKDIDALREAVVRDRMVYETARNPALIDTKARTKLNMAPPKEVVFLPKPVNVKPSAGNRIPLPQAVTHEGF